MTKLPKYFKNHRSNISGPPNYSRDIQEILKFHTCVLDSLGNILELSPSWEEFTGLSNKLLIESKLEAVIYNYDVLDIQKYWISCIEGNPNLYRQFRIRNRDGQYEWYLALSKKIDTQKWLIVFKNIHEVKIEIQQLGDVFEIVKVKEDDRFKRILELLKIGYWHSNLKFKAFFTSDVTKEHLNIPKDTRSDDLERVLSSVLPDDIRKVTEALNAAIWDGQKCDIVYRTIKDGKIRWIHALGWVDHDENGNAKTFDGITLDVTDEIISLEKLKDNEWRYKMALNATNEVVWDWDIEKNEILWNEGLNNNLGYSKEIFTTSMSWFYEQVHPEDLKGVSISLDNALKNCERYWKLEYRFRKGDGSYINVIDSGYIHYNKDNLPVRMIGSIYDKTEDNKYLAKMVEAVKLRDDFLSMASHELKTPLTSMMLQIQLMQRRLERKTANLDLVSNSFNILARQSKLLVSLIEQMLDVTKINKGQLDLNLETVDVTLVVKRLVDSYLLNLLEKNISFSEEYESDLFIDVDVFRYEQIIYNLLSNAVKYGEGKPIAISTYKADNEAILEIVDHGIGIPANQLDKIFKLFMRADNTKNISGLGLGLFISNQIITAHNGHIEVLSESGKGSTFRVHLPLKK